MASVSDFEWSRLEASAIQLSLYIEMLINHSSRTDILTARDSNLWKTHFVM